MNELRFDCVVCSLCVDAVGDGEMPVPQEMGFPWVLLAWSVWRDSLTRAVIPSEVVLCLIAFVTL